MRYRCITCRRPRQIGDPGELIQTIDVRYRQGTCKGCSALRFFESDEQIIPVTKADPALGERLKERGMAVAETSEAMTGEQWAERFDAALVELAQSGADFTSEDVTAKVGMPTRSSGAVGARMNAAAKRGDITWTGQFTAARRANQHAASLRVWRGSWSHAEHLHDTDSAETGWCSGCGRTDLRRAAQ